MNQSEGWGFINVYLQEVNNILYPTILLSGSSVAMITVR